MQARRVLLVDTDPPAARLVIDGQEPVWPVRTDTEHGVLRAFAEKFRFELCAVRGREGSTVASPDIVAAWGQDVVEEAQLYAHLTKRQFRCVSSLRALRASGRPAVLVTTLARLRNDLLSALYEIDAQGPAPGLICAPSASELRTQVLVRAAAATLPGPEGPRLSLSIGPFSALPPDPDAVELGKRRDPERLLQRLAEGAGVVSIMAHSDGVDAMLGRDLILCPMDRRPSLVESRRGSRCMETGVCHRLRVPVAQALAAPRIVPPEVLSSWCLVFGACWGVMPPDGLVDPIAGLAPRLLNSATLGAILTTWNVAPLSQDAIEHLARSLHAGVTAGDALQQFHASSLAHRTGLRFCLLGDPRVAVTPLHGVCRPPFAARAPVRTVPSQMVADRSLADIEFLRAYIDQDARHVGPELRRLATDLSVALQRYADVIGATEPAEQSEDGPGPTMRRMLLEYLAERGPRIFSVWLPFAVPNDREERAPEVCPACRLNHNRLTTLEASVDVCDGLRRRLSFCPRCGIIEDAPFGSDAKLSVGAAQDLHLQYLNAFGKPWAGVLVVRSQIAGDRMVWRWPADADGGPARQFAPTEPWPVGPLDLGLMIVSHAKLTILMQRVRAADDVAASTV